MEDRYHEGRVTDVVLREWAYDEDLFLSEQDEDAFLADFHNDLLFELADDPKCLKTSMIWTALHDKLNAAILYAQAGAQDEVNRVIAQASQSANPRTRQFGERLAERLS